MPHTTDRLILGKPVDVKVLPLFGGGLLLRPSFLPTRPIHCVVPRPRAVTKLVQYSINPRVNNRHSRPPTDLSINELTQPDAFIERDFMKLVSQNVNLKVPRRLRGPSALGIFITSFCILVRFR